MAHENLDMKEITLDLTILGAFSNLNDSRIEDCTMDTVCKTELSVIFLTQLEVDGNDDGTKPTQAK